MSSNQNTSRMIGNLAVINAWFDPVEGQANRYSLHVNAAFKTERLGGQETSNIRFRLRLKQCEVVVIIPDRGRTFVVEQRTIAMTPPADARKQIRSLENSTSAEAGVEAQASDMGLKGKLFGAGKKAHNQTTSQSDTQVIPILNTLHGISSDGFPCWTINGDYEGFLSGSLWDAHKEPRLTVIDKRPDEQRTIESEKGLSPHALIEIRCKREDLEIDEISFKELEKAQQIQNRAGQVNRIRAAESFLKMELQKEGLRVGDLSELFSDMVVADFVVPLDQ